MLIKNILPFDFIITDITSIDLLKDVMAFKRWFLEDKGLGQVECVNIMEEPKSS